MVIANAGCIENCRRLRVKGKVVFEGDKVIHETEIKPPGSKWSGPGPPRVEIGSK